MNRDPGYARPMRSVWMAGFVRAQEIPISLAGSGSGDGR
jgi:hypothetical protein